MNKLSKNIGLTLSELLLSAILIGIVMLGVAAFSSSITGTQSSTTRATTGDTAITAALAEMKADAEQATGNPSDPGIVWTPLSGPNRSICFRHDTNGNPGSTTVDLTGAANADQWVCYTHTGSNDIYRCEGPAPVAACVGAPTTRRLVASIVPGTDFYNVVAPGPGFFDYIEFNLISATDPSAASASNCDTTGSTDPMNNPCVELKTRVVPPAHSRR